MSLYTCVSFTLDLGRQCFCALLNPGPNWAGLGQFLVRCVSGWSAIMNTVIFTTLSKANAAIMAIIATEFVVVLFCEWIILVNV